MIYKSLSQSFEFAERMASLLPPEKTQLLVSVLPRREPFEILYRLNCDNLCADFKENLEFRFSWGITALISRFLGKEGHKLALTNYPSHVRTTYPQISLFTFANLNFAWLVQKLHTLFLSLVDWFRINVTK